MNVTPRLLSPRPVPVRLRLALVWCAAAALGLVAYVALPRAGNDFPHGFGGLAVVMALPAAVLLRRWPLPVMTVLLAESLLFSLAEHGHDQIALLLFLATDVALGFVAATRSRRTSIVAAATAMGVVVAVTATPALVEGGSFEAASTSALALTVVVAWMMGNSIRQRLDYAETLRAQMAAQAVVAERLRIARDLHDMVAHSVAVIAIQAGAGSRVIDTQPAEARNALAAIEATSRDTLAGLRRMLGALRQADAGPSSPAASADTLASGRVDAPAPGLADIDRLAATTLGTGVRVDITWRGDRGPLPEEIDLSAFRIIQEAVTNVVRHAGTQQCQVSVDYRHDEVAIEVLDEGRGGVVTPGTGFGIVGMRERVGLLHGQFSAGPRPEGGFRVAALLPR